MPKGGRVSIVLVRRVQGKEKIEANSLRNGSNFPKSDTPVIERIFYVKIAGKKIPNAERN